MIEATHRPRGLRSSVSEIRYALCLGGAFQLEVSIHLMCS